MSWNTKAKSDRVKCHKSKNSKIYTENSVPIAKTLNLKKTRSGALIIPTRVQ